MCFCLKFCGDTNCSLRACRTCFAFLPLFWILFPLLLLYPSWPFADAHTVSLSFILFLSYIRSPAAPVSLPPSGIAVFESSEKTRGCLKCLEHMWRSGGECSFHKDLLGFHIMAELFFPSADYTRRNKNWSSCTTSSAVRIPGSTGSDAILLVAQKFSFLLCSVICTIVLFLNQIKLSANIAFSYCSVRALTSIWIFLT